MKAILPFNYIQLDCDWWCGVLGFWGFGVGEKSVR